MTRLDEALKLAEAIITDFELSETSTARRVNKAMRLARLTEDEVATEWLNFEMYGVPNSPAGNEWMTFTGRWLDANESRGYRVGVAEVEAERDTQVRHAQALAGPISLSGDALLLAMRDHANAVVSANNNAGNMNRILARIDNQVYRYATVTYSELKFSELQASLFEQSREELDKRLAHVAGGALNKIDSIAERLTSGNLEAVSQAMATCRRLIDAVADSVFPPSDTVYNLNGQDLDVKSNRVQNRINAYVHSQGVTGSRAARIRRSLGDLYDRVSAGVHAEMDGHEARYVFLSTYVLLGEILTLGETGS
jgi:hypothetical protein